MKTLLTDELVLVEYDLPVTDPEVLGKVMAALGYPPNAIVTSLQLTFMPGVSPALVANELVSFKRAGQMKETFESGPAIGRFSVTF